MTRIIDDRFERVPGLYGAWDFRMLLEEGKSYLVEDGGRTDEGRPLYMVFSMVTSEMAKQ